MTMLEALNDMHKSNPKHAEAAAYYGMAVLAYHHIFFGIKLYVSSAEEAEGEPLTDWKSLQGDQPWYDGEPKIVKKFTEFCEKRKNRPGFPEYEEFVQSLTACCEARDKLLHAITEESREEFVLKAKKLGKPLRSADYYEELIERIQEPSKVIIKTSKDFDEFRALLSSRQ